MRKSPSFLGSDSSSAILNNVISTLLLILIGAFLAWRCPDWTHYTIELVACVVLIGGFLIWWRMGPLRKWANLYGLTIYTFLLLAVFYWLCGRYQLRGTAYLIIDRSSTMAGTVQGFEPAVHLTMDSISDDLDLGMAVFGGGISGTTGCSDHVQLVKPGPRDINKLEIDKQIERLANFQTQGPGPAQSALLQAVTQDLVGREETQQIVLITSGRNTTCGTIDRSLLDFAGREKGVTFSLSITTIGPQDPAVEEALKHMADRYVNLTSVEELPNAIPTLISPPRGVYGAPYRGPHEP